MPAHHARPLPLPSLRDVGVKGVSFIVDDESFDHDKEGDEKGFERDDDGFEHDNDNGFERDDNDGFERDNDSFECNDNDGLERDKEGRTRRQGPMPVIYGPRPAPSPPSPDTRTRQRGPMPDTRCVCPTFLRIQECDGEGLCPPSPSSLATNLLRMQERDGEGFFPPSPSFLPTFAVHLCYLSPYAFRGYLNVTVRIGGITPILAVFSAPYVFSRPFERDGEGLLPPSLSFLLPHVFEHDGEGGNISSPSFTRRVIIPKQTRRRRIPPTSAALLVADTFPQAHKHGWCVSPTLATPIIPPRWQLLRAHELGGGIFRPHPPHHHPPSLASPAGT